MFRKGLPRVYELRDQIERPGSPSAYFQDFDNSLRDEPLKMQAFVALEKELQGLDSASWDFLKNEARSYLTKKDKTKGRGWEQLFNIINQARAYNYLKTIGCSSLHFIPPSRKNRIKTPDLQSKLGSINVLCEVKTINVSDEEAVARRDRNVRTIKDQLNEGFFSKPKSDLTDAQIQLEAYDADKKTRRIIYIIINFDDLLAEYKEKYFHQIDQYLSNNRVSEIEVVFHNHATPFHKIIAMKSAAVFNE